MTEHRPDPDALLATLSGDDQPRLRGRLKIFFGAAPGVGETCAMLDASQRERRTGVDVVIGYLEPHQRAETSARAEGLESLSTLPVEYRGISVTELDLEAAIARHPQLLLVDELAHTNAPGCTNAKRWQDIEQLLDEGIDVWSTLNVQHLESINDQVAQITGVVVRERVPDSFFERAWEVELVDLPPDDLLTRLREGKIYLPDQASRAEESFFRMSNLVALREIALRRMADRVNSQLEQHRRAQPIPSTWALGDRLLVCVGPSPHSARIIRAAKRMASSLQCPWIAVHVERAGTGPLSDHSRERLLGNLRLAEALGAETAFLSAGDTVQEVVGYARKHNISKIIVGKPNQPRWKEWFRGSFVYDLTRSCGEIDVYVISGDPGTPQSRRRARSVVDSKSLRGYAEAVASVLAGTAINSLLYDRAAPVNLVMIYLLGVVSVSLRCGEGPSFLASFLSVALFDFAFVPPRWTFAVQDSQYLFTFSAMLVTGLIISSLTSRVRDQARFARDRESRTFALYQLSRELAVARDPEQIGEACVRNLRHALDAQAIVLYDSPSAASPPEALAGFRPTDRGQTVAEWVRQHGRPAGTGTDTLPASDAAYFPVGPSGAVRAVVGIQFASDLDASDPERQQLVTAVLDQMAAALERIELSRRAEAARIDVESERLRNTLLSSVSHDLRTPLAAIEGAGSTLLTDDTRLEPATRAELLRTIVEEAEHLNRLIGNLLDATRLDAGALKPHREWESIEEIVGGTLRRLSSLLTGRRIVTEFPDDMPLVQADAVLLQQALQNIVENAAKYSPSGTPIEITGRASESAVTIEVGDHGPGFAAGEETLVFERFYRAPSHASAGRPGVGLGLPVAAGIVRVHRGRIEAKNRPGGGAIFRIELPLEGEQPAAERPRTEAGS